MRLVHRLASMSSPPFLIAAMLAGTMGGYVVTRRFLERELSAPRFSDSGINEGRVTAHGDDPDLDGDGVADRFDGIFESCGAAGCAYEVYFRRPGGADEYVGRMKGYWPFRIELRGDQPADVLAPTHLGTTGTATTRYQFASGAYRR